MDPIWELKQNMDSLTEMFASKMTAFEESISTPKTDVSSLACEFNTFKSLIWKTVSNLKSQLDIIFKCRDGLEMKSRANILLLHGVPMSFQSPISMKGASNTAPEDILKVKKSRSGRVIAKNKQ